MPLETLTNDQAERINRDSPLFNEFDFGTRMQGYETNINNLTGFVKKITVCTQAEYDALPGTKTSDNCLYLIRG